MFGLHYRDALPAIVVDEFENLTAQLSGFLLEEHNEDGSHRPAVLPIGVSTGTIVSWASATPPDGWLFCRGDEVSRITYAALFEIIGVTFGAGDGSLTFNLPDLKGRFILGKATTGTGSTLGTSGGSLDHTHDGDGHTHTISGTTGSENSHTHSVNSHRHAISGAGTAAAGGDVTIRASSTQDDIFDDSGTGAGSSHSHGVGSLSTSSAGDGETGSANPPFLTLEFIIYAGGTRASSSSSSGGSGGGSGGGGGGSSVVHTLLDGTYHSDTVSEAVSRGGIIYGNTTPKWEKLDVGTGFLYADGTDVVGWTTNNLALLNAINVFTEAPRVIGDLSSYTFVSRGRAADNISTIGLFSNNEVTLYGYLRGTSTSVELLSTAGTDSSILLSSGSVAVNGILTLSSYLTLTSDSGAVGIIIKGRASDDVGTLVFSTNSGGSNHGYLQATSSGLILYNNVGTDSSFELTSGLATILGGLTTSSLITVTADSSADGVKVKGRAADDIGTVTFFSNNGATRYGYIYGTPDGIHITNLVGGDTTVVLGDNLVTVDANSIVLDGDVSVSNAYTFPNTDGNNDQVLTTNGGGVVTWTDKAGGGGGGITSLEGQTGATQTFADDTNVKITSASNTHTLGWNGTLSVARGGTASSSASAARTALGTDDATNLTTGTIPNARVSALPLANIASITTARLLGRSTAGTGVIEQLTIGTGLTLAGGNLTATAATAPFVVATDHGITAGDVSTYETANTTAFNSMIASNPGSVIFFPAGTFRFNGAVTSTGQCITLMGSGTEGSILKWNATGGFNFTVTDYNTQKLKISDLTFTTTVVGNTSPAISIYGNVTNLIGNHYSINNVAIRAENFHLTGGYYVTGIKINGEPSVDDSHGIGNVDIYDCFFQGVNSGGTVAGTIGVQCTGRNFGVRVINAQFINLDYGVKINQKSESVMVINSSFGACENGVFANGNTFAAGIFTSLIARNCDIACTKTGIYIDGGYQSNLESNLVYNYSPTVPSFVGIMFDDTLGVGAGQNRITNNFVYPVYSQGGSNKYGIYHTGSNCIISGNMTIGCTIGITLDAGAGSNLLVGNMNTSAGTKISNSGAGNTLANNV